LNEKVIYSGQNTGAKIAHWLKTFNGDSITKEVTCGELQKESAEKDYTLAYFGDVTLPLFKKTYEKYALNEERIKYIHVSIDETSKCGSQYGVK
jgi:hypothetical protein